MHILAIGLCTYIKNVMSNVFNTEIKLFVSKICDKNYKLTWCLFFSGRHWFSINTEYNAFLMAFSHMHSDNMATGKRRKIHWLWCHSTYWSLFYIVSICVGIVEIQFSHNDFIICMARKNLGRIQHTQSFPTCT